MVRLKGSNSSTNNYDLYKNARNMYKAIRRNKKEDYKTKIVT